MTDSRTRFFSRWQRDMKRREMLRRMKIWMKELSKKNDKPSGKTDRVML